ncbi:hypothetical protein JCM9533A_63930 [Catenuloplanes niger JCM 9533]
MTVPDARRSKRVPAASWPHRGAPGSGPPAGADAPDAGATVFGEPSGAQVNRCAHGPAGAPPAAGITTVVDSGRKSSP